MPDISYLDTSFLLKSYLFEHHSPEVTQFIRTPGPKLLVSSLTDIEMAAAFAKQLSLEQARQAFSFYQVDKREGVYEGVGLPSEVYTIGQTLALRFGAVLYLRSLDALHVATALHYGASQIATYDRRLAVAARELGLSVIGAQV